MPGDHVVDDGINAVSEVPPRIAAPDVGTLVAGVNCRDKDEPTGSSQHRPTALFVWGNWGPYHYARFNAAAELLGRHGIGAEGLELFSQSGIYQWSAAAPNQQVHRLGFPPPEMKFRPWLLITKAVPFLRRMRPTVIFVPSYWPWSLFLNVAARCFGARVVMMNETHAATAHNTRFRNAVRGAVVRRFSAALVGGAPHVDYFSSLGLARERIFQGYDAVDNKFFAEGAAEARANADRLRAHHRLPKHYFLSLGRLVEKKNLGQLIEAYSRLPYRTDVEFPSLVIVGYGPEEGRLHDLCRKVGLRVRTKSDTSDDTRDDSASRTVFFYPGVGPGEATDFFGLADAFILPSTTEEWGLVVNEAMASGLPVLVSREAGCAPDLVKVGRNGFTFDPREPEDLARWMELLIDSPQLAAQMSRASEAIIADWGPDRFARGALEAYAVSIPR